LETEGWETKTMKKKREGDKGGEKVHGLRKCNREYESTGINVSAGGGGESKRRVKENIRG